METLLDDLRHALRSLGKARGFTAVALLTLALGTGANSTLFSIVDGVLFSPLPFPEPDRLVGVHASKPNFDRGSISYPNFRDWHRENSVFAQFGVSRSTNFTVTGSASAEQVAGAYLSGEFLPALGVQPLLGRQLLPGEDEVGAPPVALISAAFRERHFGAGAEVLGQTLTLDGRPYTVVGVVPDLDPSGLNLPRRSEVYVPIGQWTNDLLLDRGAGLGIHGIARLRPGVTLAQARGALEGVTRALAEAYPATNRGIGATLRPLHEQIVGGVRAPLLLLLAAVGFVLLIACVNVANLLLARSSARAREFAVRSALGAGRGRIVRQLLTESIVLALLGGIGGLLLAALARGSVVALTADVLPRTAEIRIDGRVLGFTFLASLLSGVVFGVVPALVTAHRSPFEALRDGSGGAGGRHRAQRLFVVVEIALALVLLIGAGLMARTLARLWSVDPGFNPDRVLTLGLSLPPAMNQAEPPAIRAAFRDVHQTLHAVSGVRAVSFSAGAFPLSGDDEALFWIDGRPRPASENEMSWTLSYVVEPDYLEAMGLRLLRGRFLGASDDAHAPPVVVVDDVFASTYFPGGDAVGQRIRVERESRPIEIVGVVGHVKQWGLDSDDRNSLRAQAYFAFAQASDGLTRQIARGVDVIVRTEGSPRQAVAPIQRASAQMSSQQATFGVQTLREVISDSLSRQRFAMILFGIFGGLALVLASIGIYGVVSYVVGQRTGEIGLRMALGARERDVQRLVLGGGGLLALGGVAVGLGAAAALSRMMAGLLYQVPPVDLPTFLGMAVLLLGVALGASFLPARRAARVDPMVALRQE
jgi:predicted permease